MADDILRAFLAFFNNGGVGYGGTDVIRDISGNPTGGHGPGTSYGGGTGGPNEPPTYYDEHGNPIPIHFDVIGTPLDEEEPGPQPDHGAVFIRGGQLVVLHFHDMNDPRWAMERAADLEFRDVPDIGSAHSVRFRVGGGFDLIHHHDVNDPQYAGENDWQTASDVQTLSEWSFNIGARTVEIDGVVRSVEDVVLEESAEIVVGEEMVFQLGSPGTTASHPVVLEEMVFNLRSAPSVNDGIVVGEEMVLNLREGSASAGDVKSGTLSFKFSDNSYLAVRAVVGSAASDFFQGSGWLIGGAGNDTMIGNFMHDTLHGGTGSDVLNGREGRDVLYGGEGFDFANYWNSGAGVFVSLASPEANTGEAAGDIFVSIEGLEGSQHGDTLVGDWQDNILRGFTGDDVLNGREGRDTLDGGAGSDTADYFNASSGVVASLTGGRGTGGEATDDVYLSIENLTGSWHGDILVGDAQDNRLVGLGGNDRLTGGEGNDVLWGGDGQDSFWLGTALDASTNVDTIMDFDVADDTIHLNRWTFGNGTAWAGTLQASAFRNGVSAATAEERIVYNPWTGDLFYDPDGSGTVEQVRFAKLGAGLALTAADFVLFG
jgi:Ca2+-binding RTX toxin-like protein